MADVQIQQTPDAGGSSAQALPAPPEEMLTVAQQETTVRCTAPSADGAAVQWSYRLDGTETRSRIGREARSSVAKWEGSALLTNTLISGPQDYTVMDRWRLSRDRSACSS